MEIFGIFSVRRVLLYSHSSEEMILKNKNIIILLIFFDSVYIDRKAISGHIYSS